MLAMGAVQMAWTAAAGAATIWVVAMLFMDRPLVFDMMLLGGAGVFAVMAIVMRAMGIS